MQKDAQLVEQALSGNHQAFHILITQYYTAIYNTILSWVKDPEDAKDLTQEVFISAYQKLSSLRHPERFYSWLRQIAIRISQNWQRKEQISLVPLDDNLISKEPSVDEVLILRETLAKVMEAIDNLPESEKRLLKEHYLDDVSYDELEAKHGVSTKALVVRLVRARRKIRDQLEKTLSAFVAFLHDHTESILTGGVEAVKISVKTKLIVVGIAIIMVSGGTGIFIWHSHQSTMKSPKVSVSQLAQNMLQQSSAKPIIAKNTKGITTDKPTNQEIEKSKEDETNKPIIDEHTDQAVKATVILSDNPVEKAEQVVNDTLNACTAGDLQLYTSYFRGKAKDLNTKMIEDWLAAGNSLDGLRNTLIDNMSKFKIVNTKYTAPDRAIVELIVGYISNENPRTGGALYEYKTGDNYDIVMNFFYYVDRYNDGWYISDISAKADETEKEK